jgi:phospholipid/cholesterol/gamma-HCH transport system ATP-binding protein
VTAKSPPRLPSEAEGSARAAGGAPGRAELGSAPKIEMRGVAKAFGSNRVLRGVDLSVARGTSVVIIGGSGTGKSVTLKCVLGIVRPDSGTIRVDGEDASRLRGRDRERLLDKFGMLFQGGALFDSLPVWQNVAFRLLQGRRRKPAAEAREIAIEKLRRVGLTAATADLYPAELSGGMQKRVGLARAIAAEPEIIFFDEPTTGLDPIMADVINDLIREIVTELGITAMTITHDMTSVRKIADRVAMLHAGVIQWEGPVGEIDTTPNPYVHQFVNGLPEGPIAAVR